MIQLVLKDLLEWRNSRRVIMVGNKEGGSVGEIKRQDLEKASGGGRGKEGEGGSAGVEMEGRVEDRMGILEFVKGGFEARGMGGFGEQEGQDGDAGAARNRPAPSVLAPADCSSHGGVHHFTRHSLLYASCLR